PGLVGGISVSPDGQRLAYIGRLGDGNRAIWVRSIASDAAQRLAGTENLTGGPAWSPDSRHLAFFGDGKLKKVDVLSGAIQVLCDLAGPFRGIDWNRNGVILFAKPGSNNLVRVSDAGGTVTDVTTLDANRKETIHVTPTFLPDGKHFVFGVGSSVPDN